MGPPLRKHSRLLYRGAGHGITVLYAPLNPKLILQRSKNRWTLKQCRADISPLRNLDRTRIWRGVDQRKIGNYHFIYSGKFKMLQLSQNIQLVLLQHIVLHHCKNFHLAIY
jgi:hypothetical protein